jgi:signal transduction histidine kinase
VINRATDEHVDARVILMSNVSALDLLQSITWTIYIVIFLATVRRAIQTRRRVKVDVCLLFAATTLIIILSVEASILPANLRAINTLISAGLLMSIPFFLMRLVDDFTTVPPLIMRLVEAGFALSVLAIFVVPQPYPFWVVGPLIAYFVILEGYGAFAFMRAAGRSRGVTRRRMQAVAFGSACLSIELLIAGVAAAIPSINVVVVALIQLVAIASAIGYFTGFAPPAWLRRAWQAPELRTAVQRSAGLIRLPGQTEAIRALEQSIADALGATSASIGQWNEATGTLDFTTATSGGDASLDPSIPPRVFASQRPLFREYPRSAKTASDDHGVYHPAIMAAPITLEKRRIGVLAVSSLHAPIFGDEDLELTALLADQAAVILETRALIDESARDRARSEAHAISEEERRKVYEELEVRVAERTSELQQALGDIESFSYSVSHDLRAPLRTIDGFSQALIEDCYEQLGDEGQSALRRIRAASHRMSEIIDGLLRLSRVTRTEFSRMSVNLSELVRSVANDFQRSDPDRRVDISIQDGIVAQADLPLMRVVVDNLVGNAWKFTANREYARIEFTAASDAGRTIYAIRDNGAGFDMAYSDKLFGPFQRLHRRDEFDGTGIGLATVQRIISRHGGTIWAEAGVDRGATFYFTLGDGIGSEKGEAVDDNIGTRRAPTSDSADRR